MAYADQEYYLYEKTTGIWKKGIDQNPPTYWYPVKLSEWYGRSLKAAFGGRALILNRGKGYLEILDLVNYDPIRGKIGKFVISVSPGSFVYDFKVIGEDQDYLIVLTNDGQLTLFSLDLETKNSSIVATKSFDMLRERSERALTLSVSQDSRFFAIQTYSAKKPKPASRLIIGELYHDRFVEKNSLDLYSQGLSRFRASEFVEAKNEAGSRKLVLCTLSDDGPSLLVSYAYDVQTGALGEIRAARKTISVENIVRLIKMDENLVCTGSDGRKACIRYF